MQSVTRNTPTVSCPHCGKPVPWNAQSLFRPFCSERCKLIDLGAWANEEYRVAVRAEDEEANSEDAGPGAP